MCSCQCILRSRESQAPPFCHFDDVINLKIFDIESNLIILSDTNGNYIKIGDSKETETEDSQHFTCSGKYSY